MQLNCSLSRFIAIIFISQIITIYAFRMEELARYQRCPFMRFDVDMFLGITEDSYRERVKVFQYANISNFDYDRAYQSYIEATKNLPSNKGIEMTLLSYDALDKDQLNRKENLIKYGPVLKDCGDTCWYFPIEPVFTEELQMFTIEHASLRFLFKGDRYSPNTTIKLTRRREFDMIPLYNDATFPILVDPSESRWLEYNITETAMLWLKGHTTNLGMEIFFHDDISFDHPLHHVSDVTLNIFIRYKPLDQTIVIIDREKRSTPEQTTPREKVECSSRNDTCCRGKVNLMFKDLAMFDFVVYPKGYMAGTCIGPCPFKHDCTDHHTLMQDAIKDKNKTFKPKCKPTKWGELIAVYYDQDDPSLLKVGYWKDKVILECDCY